MDGIGLKREPDAASDHTAEVRREWLGWTKPVLPEAASWLIPHGGDGATCDLQRLICVVPGLRAGRLLLRQLAEHCLAEKRHLIPPEICTPGRLVDTLAPHGDVPTANSYEHVMAWMTALRATDADVLRPLLPHCPDADESIDWYDLAVTIARLAEELAGQQIAFADVAEHAERLELFGEGDRWRALESLHETYRAVLAEAGLVDAHEAGWEAIRSHTAPDDRMVVLLGVIELNAMQRAIVRKWGDRCVALIQAPASLSDRFDALGCIDATRWKDATIEIEDEQIIVADHPNDQAQAVLRTIAGFDGQYAAEQITVGLGDESLAEVCVTAGRWAGISLHAAPGRQLRRTAPWSLLAAVAKWLSDQRFASFAALLRHPDLEARLLQYPQVASAGLDNWQTLLDEYFCEYLHERFTGRWLGDPTQQQRLAAVYDAVNTLLAPLSGSDRRTLGEWSRRTLEVLRDVYGSIQPGEEPANDTGLVDVCKELRDTCAEIAAAPARLQPETLGQTALRLLLTRAAGRQVPTEPRRGEIEMLGWLELHLDVAPALIVTGFNDGDVPKAVTADAFLPDGLRQRLGLTDNTRRYARDAYIIEALRHSREHLTIVMARTTADGEPLTPSRLLLACPRSQLPARIKVVCDEPQAKAWRPPVGIQSPGRTSQFEVPPVPSDLRVPQAMRVTWFGDYLRCPYRFALRRLVGLQSRTDTAMELDPLQFGTLAHDVLRAFGDDDIADSADVQDIEAFLVDALNKETHRRFGDDPMPAVRVQIARLAHRLRSFASFQAEQRQEGWIIRHSELQFTQDNSLDVPGQDPMPIRGRIDRIDQHQDTGVWRIIDYKTGESGGSPFQTHHGRKTLPKNGDVQWLDLQLPLYHYLAAQHGITGDVELAYIVLPKQADGVALKTAQWEPDHLDSAIDVARDVVREIRAGRFEIKREFRSQFDEFARICQSLVFAGDLAEDGGS